MNKRYSKTELLGFLDRVYNQNMQTMIDYRAGKVSKNRYNAAKENSALVQTARKRLLSSITF